MPRGSRRYSGTPIVQVDLNDRLGVTSQFQGSPDFGGTTISMYAPGMPGVGEGLDGVPGFQQGPPGFTPAGPDPRRQGSGGFNSFPSQSSPYEQSQWGYQTAGSSGMNTATQRSIASMDYQAAQAQAQQAVVSGRYGYARRGGLYGTPTMVHEGEMVVPTDSGVAVIPQEDINGIDAFFNKVLPTPSQRRVDTTQPSWLKPSPPPAQEVPPIAPAMPAPVQPAPRQQFSERARISRGVQRSEASRDALYRNSDRLRMESGIDPSIEVDPNVLNQVASGQIRPDQVADPYTRTKLLEYFRDNPGAFQSMQQMGRESIPWQPEVMADIEAQYPRGREIEAPNTAQEKAAYLGQRARREQRQAAILAQKVLNEGGTISPSAVNPGDSLPTVQELLDDQYRTRSAERRQANIETGGSVGGLRQRNYQRGVQSDILDAQTAAAIAHAQARGGNSIGRARIEGLAGVIKSALDNGGKDVDIQSAIDAYLRNLDGESAQVSAGTDAVDGALQTALSNPNGANVSTLVRHLTQLPPEEQAAIIGQIRQHVDMQKASRGKSRLNAALGMPSFLWGDLGGGGSDDGYMANLEALIQSFSDQG